MTTSPRQLPPPVADFPARYARTGRFTLGTPRNVTVTAGGSRVLFCRPNSGDDAVLCLWALDVESGTERLVVDPANLDEAGDDLPPAERARRERARESASGIVAYSTDRDGGVACFALAGELFVVDLASGAVTSPEHAGSAYDPRLDPRGGAVAYVHDRALRLLQLGVDRAPDDRELLASDDPLVSYGRAEFIAAEEMDRARGFWWAPDGSRLLVTRVDESRVTEWWITDPAHPDRAPAAIRFPPAGTANAAVELELVTTGGRVDGIDWSDGGRFEYLADVVWTADHLPLIVRQTRDQRLVSIAELRLEDLVVSERHRIVDDTWVELIAGSPKWSSAGLLTVEDRADARHLCLDGHPLTGTDLNVRSIVGLVPGDEGDRAAVVSAWTVPTEVHLVAVPLPAAGSTPAPATHLLTAERGVHTAVMGGETIVVTSSRPDVAGSRITVHRLDLPLAPEPSAGPGNGDTASIAGPGNGDTASIAGPGNGDTASIAGPGGLLATVSAAIADRSADPGLAARPAFLTLARDELQAALFLPSHHDGHGPLPVLLDPYGGPHAQRVLASHNAHLVSRWFAEHGYAVLVTDGRGTPGRGPAWERAVWGDLAGPVLDDQLAALDAALERFDVLDGSRVGIRGWSFGGYLAALAVLRRPDRFHAAVAGAPVTAWGLYDTHYTERYLGHPDEHPDNYRRSDLLDPDAEATGRPLLNRPLLLIHGLADDNVVAAHTLRFSAALLASGAPHRVLPLSGVTHMASQEAVAENLLRLQLAFLDETIGTPPS